MHDTPTRGGVAGSRAASERPPTLCVLLWARDGEADALAAYEDRVLPIVEEHGGQVVFRGRADEGADGPTEVHLLVYPSQHALDAYLRDERRVALDDERDRVVARTDVISLRQV